VRTATFPNTARHKATIGDKEPRLSPGREERHLPQAYRHGLSVPIANVESEARLKDLSRQLVKDVSSNSEILALADRAADAQLDLVRIRKAWAAMIERVELLDCSTSLPQGNEEEQRRLANAIRPILSELAKICRYENRAAARRNRAIREIVSIKTAE
jgi:hypothetical protein